MVKSQFGRRMSEAMRMSAEYRRCPLCGRGAAMVTRYLPDTRLIVCLWAERGKCEDAGIAVPYPPG
jgi:hypothetical protein